MKLTLPVPDYSTVSRRQGALQVRLPVESGSNPRHIVIDATGLKVYDAGEWHVRKHRVVRRRTWRTLHLGVNETAKGIVAVEVTGSRVHDSQPLPALLDQIPDPIVQVSRDGAYDTRKCYDAVLQRVGPHRSSSLGAQPNPAPLRIPPGGVSHAIVSFSRLPSMDARRGEA